MLNLCPARLSHCPGRDGHYNSSFSHHRSDDATRLACLAAHFEIAMLPTTFQTSLKLRLGLSGDSAEQPVTGMCDDPKLRTTPLLSLYVEPSGSLFIENQPWK